MGSSSHSANPNHPNNPAENKSLPVPSAAQIERSEQLLAQIKHLIEQNDGWLAFDQYMNAALYTSDLGYYANELSPFSMWAEQGDFITAPLLSPLFGASVAEQALEVFDLMPDASPSILEFGAGTGRLAADILQFFAERQMAVNYSIMELSGSLRAQQRATIHEALAGFEHQHDITWLDALPENFNGVVLGNEVLDAMPVRLIGMRDGVWFERGVAIENHQLVWQDRPTNAQLPMDTDWQQALRLSQSQYLSETHEQQIAFMHSVVQCVQRGVIVMIDYGFPVGEFYHPQRNTGTLMCHIQHTAHDDALYYPGVQDITAHVNFSALTLSDVPDVQVIGYTSQANFLINNGILQQLSQYDEQELRVQANRVQRLLSEAEMGELFKVMAWSKGLDFEADETLQGFVRGDRSDTL